MFDNFIELISPYKKLNKIEISYIKDNIAVKFYKKGEIISKEGNIADTIYFILNGYVRKFYNIDAEEKTVSFYTDGTFFCPVESYIFKIPMKESYHAIEDTTLMHFEKQKIEELVRMSPEFADIALIVSNNELIQFQQMSTSFITLSPEQRYLDLLKSNPGLFLRVPQQYIASYLGVSPETLSRIKKRTIYKS